MDCPVFYICYRLHRSSHPGCLPDLRHRRRYPSQLRHPPRTDFRQQRWDYASVSFVLAITQLSFGIMQPLFGVLSMKKSSAFVLRLGVTLMTGGLLLLPFCRSLWTLLPVLGLTLPSGTAALSFGIVMGVLTPRLPRQAVSTASGIVTASCGVGSTLFSPLIQALTAAPGLLGTALFLSVPSLLLLPVSLFLCRPAKETAPTPKEEANVGLVSLVRKGIKSRGLLLFTGRFLHLRLPYGHH